MKKLFLLGLLLCSCLFGCAKDNQNEAEIQEKIAKMEAKMAEGEPIFMEYLPTDEGEDSIYAYLDEKGVDLANSSFGGGGKKGLTDHQCVNYLSKDLKEYIFYLCFDKNLEHPFILKNSQVGERVYVELVEDETMEITEFPYELCVRFVSEKPFHFIYVYRDGDVFSGSGRGAEPPY